MRVGFFLTPWLRFCSRYEKAYGREMLYISFAGLGVVLSR
jgi:hypothetical protein